jgi:thiamine biosynthesis lipoprotein
MGRFRYLPPVIIICAILGVVAARTLRNGDSEHSESAIMMDTFVEVSVWGKGTVGSEAAVDSAFMQIARVESLLADCIVSTVTDKDVLESEAFEYLLKVSRQVHSATDGKFDPTIGMVSRLWHFGEGAAPPPADSLEEALGRVGLATYLAGTGPEEYIFDLGGVAKGYAVDLAAAKLCSLGIHSAIMNAGGDLRLVGRRPDGKPWRIAIRHPRRSGAFIGYLDLEDVAVATSGDYEKYFFHDGRRYHHILDPGTGMPRDECNSVTVVASSACLSDALATGLFLLGPERGLAVVESDKRFEAVFAFAEGESIAVSTGLADRFVRFETE